MAQDLPLLPELHVDSINWELSPPPEAPAMPVTEQAVEAIVDGLSYRLLACEALDRLRKLTLQVDRLRTENTELRERLRQGTAPC